MKQSHFIFKPHMLQERDLITCLSFHICGMVVCATTCHFQMPPDAVITCIIHNIFKHFHICKNRNVDTLCSKFF